MFSGFRQFLLRGNVIDLAIEMGKMICVCDPDEVRARDEMFLTGYDGGVTAIPPFPGISEGIVFPGSPKAGELFVQGDVGRDGLRMRFDDAVGAGWRLVTHGPVAVDAALVDWFASIGGTVVAVGVPGLVDVDGTYGRWFAVNGVIAALQRPDFALFGTAAEPSDVDGLVRSLQDRLAEALSDLHEIKEPFMANNFVARAALLFSTVAYLAM
jgi:hypothetical protein